MPSSAPQYLRFSDPSLAEARKTHLKFFVIAFAAITVFSLGLNSVYWGSYFRQEENAYRITIRLIDLDSQASAGGAVLGPEVIAASQQNVLAYPHYHLGWQIEEDLEKFSLAANGAPANASKTGIDADEYARGLVLNQDFFGVVVVHSNATSAAVQAYEQGLTTYQPQGAISFYYEEARNFYSTDQYAVFHTTQLLSAAIGTAADLFAARVLSEASSAASGFNFTGLCPNDAATLPALGESSTTSAIPINSPFWYSTFNLRPFDAFAAIASTTAGAIYLIIFTYFIGLFFKNTFEPLHPKLAVSSEILMRLVVPLIGYFWISLMYSLVSLAFQVPFDRFYGRVGFFIYWLLNWVTQMGLGFTMELVLLVGGPLIFPFFLLVWVIFNVSPVFLDLADIDHFWSYGFILPVWNNVDASKSIIFGTKNHLGQNFGVCLGWMVFSMVGVAVVTVVRKGRAMKEATLAREKVIAEVQQKQQHLGALRQQK